MSNIHTLGDKRKRKRSPVRRVMLTIKNGVSMVQRDDDGNALYHKQELQTKKRRLEKPEPAGLKLDRVATASRQLHPIAQLMDVESVGDGWRVEWKNSGNERLTEALFTLSPWILVGHHDSQESAMVVHGVEVSAQADGSNPCAMISKAACALPIGKLKRALVCAGPQKSSPEDTRELAGDLPKSSRSLAVSIATFDRLSKAC